MLIRKLSPCLVIILGLALTPRFAYSQDEYSLFDDSNQEAQPSESSVDPLAKDETEDAAESPEARKLREHFRLLRNLVYRGNKPETRKQIAIIREFLQSEGGLAAVVLETAADDAKRAAALNRAGDLVHISRFDESLDRPGRIGKQHLNEFERMVASLKVLREGHAKGMDGQGRRASGILGAAGYETGGYGGGGYGGGGGGYGEGGALGGDDNEGGHGGGASNVGYGASYGAGYGGYGGSDGSDYGGGYGGGYGMAAPTAADESALQQTQLQDQIDVLRIELRKATPESSRKIVAAIGKLVSEQFDGRTADRKGKLDALERRLENLRLQLQQRNEAKADIVDVRVKTYVNEARGLGF